MVRFKNRYVAIEVASDGKSGKPLVLKGMTLHLAVCEKVQQLYGDFGAAAIKAGLSSKYCNIHTKIALIKVRHGPHRFVVNSVPKINNIGGSSVTVKIIYVGATLKHCFDFVRKYQQRKLEQVWSTLRTKEQRNNMETALMSMTGGMKDFQ